MGGQAPSTGSSAGKPGGETNTTQVLETDTAPGEQQMGKKELPALPEEDVEYQGPLSYPHKLIKVRG